jgi:hypothetical protein
MWQHLRLEDSVLELEVATRESLDVDELSRPNDHHHRVECYRNARICLCVQVGILSLTGGNSDYGSSNHCHYKFFQL